MLINHQELCSLIPHAGTMCLLDHVLTWDDHQIHCRSTSHRSLENPLRANGALSALHGLEFGAQAMAVHGGLLARREGKENPPGYLVAARDLEIHVTTLNEIEQDLDIKAQCLFAEQGNLMYQIEVAVTDRILVQGRVTVMLSGKR